MRGKYYRANFSLAKKIFIRRKNIRGSEVGKKGLFLTTKKPLFFTYKQDIHKRTLDCMTWTQDKTCMPMLGGKGRLMDWHDINQEDADEEN